jgi:hypothetical protein
VALKSDWLVTLNAGLSAMKVCAAGLTAMLFVQALIDASIQPDDCKILVTGQMAGRCNSDYTTCTT